MRPTNAFLQVAGELVSIVVLALTARFIGFAQSTLESGVPLSVQRAFGHFTDILSVFTRLGSAGLLLSVLLGASLVRIAIAYANRSMLLGLRERAGVGEENITWSQRALRLPYAVLYRTLNGLATLIGALALAIAFRLFNPEQPFGFAELGAYTQSLAGSMTYAGIGAMLLLFALYGVAFAFIGYIASPAVLSLDEMASGCRPERRAPQPRRLESASA